MFMRRSNSPDLTQEIQKMTQDYEKLSKEQKDRILSLREENRSLSAKLEACLKEKEAISSTLVRAEQTSQQLIQQAKQRCDQLISDAYRKEEASKKRIEEHRAMLQGLAIQCENILNSIENELKGPSGCISLELVSKKKA